MPFNLIPCLKKFQTHGDAKGKSLQILKHYDVIPTCTQQLNSQESEVDSFVNLLDIEIIRLLRKHVRLKKNNL